jgi:glycosyltransferase involved in cell wall biosynthesis
MPITDWPWASSWRATVEPIKPAAPVIRIGALDKGENEGIKDESFAVRWRQFTQGRLVLSVTIITKNEENRIARCLRSVAFAHQRVVLDSGSTDQTCQIARDLGAEIHQSIDWPGFGIQKNRALALAREPWVLSLDADEVLSETLQQQVQAVEASDGLWQGRHYNGFWLRRHSRFCGKLVRFGDWQGDRVLRLFRRSSGRFTDDLVHERLVVEGEHTTLPGILEHDSVDSWEDGFRKMRRYAWLSARKLAAQGRGSPGSAWVHGVWTVFRGLVLRAGLLDGLTGLKIAWLNGQGSYLKYRWAGLARAGKLQLQGDLE